MSTITRPLVFLGAAFLVTVSAALFAPILLLFIALPTAFVLLFSNGKLHTAAIIVSVGCLMALAASGLFFVRLNSARALVNTVKAVSGTVFFDSGRQMALVSARDGKRYVTVLFPQDKDFETGDSFDGTIRITSAEAGSGHHLLSGGILLETAPEKLTYLKNEKPPLAIRGMLLRRRLANELRLLAPIPATDITVAVLFSLKEYLPQSLRQAFSSSGMSHLLAVSGLHLSILVWTLVGFIQRMGGGKLLQTLIGSFSALLIFFTAGMTPSVFRATIMILLTLLASLLSRKPDGLTSLSLAAVILVLISPPVIADLSFLLSFTSVAGIMLLSPRFSAVLERIWIARFARCGKTTRMILSALSVSASAQLATAPVLAICFGELPLLGMVINLAAIPLVYPILIFGFATCLSFALSPSISALLLLPANMCSALLGIIARSASKIPFGTMPVIFPLDFLPIFFLLLLATCTALFPHKVRLLRQIGSACLACALFSFTASCIVNYNSVIIASSSLTGNLVLTYRNDTVILENSQSEYHRQLTERLMLRLGSKQTKAVAVTYPYDIDAHTVEISDYYGSLPIYTFEDLSSPTELLPKVQISVPQPYITKIMVGSTKLMKFYATYDTMDIVGENIADGDILLVDRQGNMLSLGGIHYIFRRGNGDSFTRIYMK